MKIKFVNNKNIQKRTKTWENACDLSSIF